MYEFPLLVEVNSSFIALISRPFKTIRERSQGVIREVEGDKKGFRMKTNNMWRWGGGGGGEGERGGGVRGVKKM